jgi:hypothetical protein
MHNFGVKSAKGANFYLLAQSLICEGSLINEQYVTPIIQWPIYASIKQKLYIPTIYSVLLQFGLTGFVHF